MSGNVRLGLAVASFCAVAATLLWHPDWIIIAIVALMPMGALCVAMLAGPPKGGDKQWIVAGMLGTYWAATCIAPQSAIAAVIWGISYGTACALLGVEHYNLKKK